jgi:hypothetical protein
MQKSLSYVIVILIGADTKSTGPPAGPGLAESLTETGPR